MERKLHVLILGLLLSKFSANAQQGAQYTQYMYNTLAINPAYVGTREAISITGLNRTQWSGIDGAPRTMNLSVSGPISEKIGLGASVVYDQIGPSNETLIAADISYNARLNYDYWLFFGLKASAALLNIDYTKLNPYNTNDLVFQNNVHDFSPNIGAGIFLMSENTYVGISTPILIDTSDFDERKDIVARRRIHYYGMAGHVFEMSDNVKFKPTVLLDYVNGNALQINLSANFLVYNKLTLGTAYRWNAAVSALIGVQLTKGLFVGYTYDADTTKLGKYNSGSHELFFRFDLPIRIMRDCSCSSARFF
ncbi:type IX secretion system membrane protein PorP/SprF [Flavobacterium sp. N502536]|uniref:PorP/SprF family type IX secretion system membrane protein n=1 Tax=Flavobacterium sp. N502536 TaxID=2986837 RepID=UPI0022217848|nr:type IX secretion system membrane protein PorP/SprF [Flavobacterium sp. N502536]